MEKVSSVMALRFNEIEKASGSVKIGTTDTNAGLIVLYIRLILFWRARDRFYHLGLSKVLCSIFSSQELRRSLQVRWQDEWIVQNRSGRSGRI